MSFMEIQHTVVVLPPKRCRIASYTSYCLLHVVVLPPTRRIASYAVTYCLLHVVVLPPTR